MISFLKGPREANPAASPRRRRYGYEEGQSTCRMTMLPVAAMTAVAPLPTLPVLACTISESGLPDAEDQENASFHH